MSYRILTIPISALLVVLAIHITSLDAIAANPWVQNFSPTRQLYVSKKGNGPGTDALNPMNFDTAITMAMPGDLFWMQSGKYKGDFNLYRNGTSSKPIVFRALPGHHVVIKGSIGIFAAYTWFWGLEITDPKGVALGQNVDSGVRMVAPGVHLINNVIHHQRDKNGIGAWDGGRGQVVYGNIVYENGQGENHHPHNIYVQNDFSKYGYKYIVSNVFLDAASVCSGCFNVNGYATLTGVITGIHLEKNIISNGRLLIGGYNLPADNEVVVGNYLYNSQAQFGYARPSQVQFKDNYLARSYLMAQFFWGMGETLYTQTSANVFTGNEILLPPDNMHVNFRTSAYLSTGRCEGCPPIHPTDIFNDNKYSTPFRATFQANNSPLTTLGFTAWKNASVNAGNSFDVKFLCSSRSDRSKNCTAQQ